VLPRGWMVNFRRRTLQPRPPTIRLLRDSLNRKKSHVSVDNWILDYPVRGLVTIPTTLSRFSRWTTVSVRCTVVIAACSTTFGKKNILEIKVCSDFLYNFYLNFSHCTNSQRDITINVHRFSCSVPAILVRF